MHAHARGVGVLKWEGCTFQFLESLLLLKSKHPNLCALWCIPSCLYALWCIPSAACSGSVGNFPDAPARMHSLWIGDHRHVLSVWTVSKLMSSQMNGRGGELMLQPGELLLLLA